MWLIHGGFNLHICRSLLPQQAPLPQQTTTTQLELWQIRTVTPPLIRIKKQGDNDLKRRLTNANEG